MDTRCCDRPSPCLQGLFALCACTRRGSAGLRARRGRRDWVAPNKEPATPPWGRPFPATSGDPSESPRAVLQLVARRPASLPRRALPAGFLKVTRVGIGWGQALIVYLSDGRSDVGSDLGQELELA